MVGAKKKVLGNLNINFDLFDAKDCEGEYLFKPGNVVSTRRKCVYIPNWSSEDINAVDEQLDIYDKVPILCKGKNCDFADECPLVRNGLVKRWVGSRCPIETIAAFRHFAGYVNTLDVNPEDYVDVNIVNDLVRLNIQMARCDKLAALADMAEVTVQGTDQRSGLKYSQKQPSTYIAQQKEFRASIQKHLQLLLATRKSKLDAQSKQQGKEDVSSALSELYAKIKEMEAPVEKQKVTTGFARKLELD